MLAVHERDRRHVAHAPIFALAAQESPRFCRFDRINPPPPELLAPEAASASVAPPTPSIEPAPARDGPRSDGVLRRLQAWLPQGKSLPDADWDRRHHGLLFMLWALAAGIPAYGMARGYRVEHSLFEGSPLVILAALGSIHIGSRRLRSAMVSLGLLTASAVAVHLSGGVIEAHFFFFVMIALLTLYEDWLPFGLAVGYVVFHHGVVGTLDSGSVYNHGDAVAHPWKWAGIHAAFVTAAGAAGVLTWRLNEQARSETARAYESARDSEQRFRKGFDSSPIGMALASPDGQFVRVNDALCEKTGYSQEELLGRGFADITHPGDVQASLDFVSRIVEGEIDSYKTEKRYMHKGGETIDAIVSVSCVRDRDGELRHFFAQVQDITERKRAEEELAQSLSLVTATLESTADGILVVDAEGRISHFNEEFRRMWRIPGEILDSGDDERAISFVLEQLADPDLFLSKVRELYDDPDATSYDVLHFKDGRVLERYSQPQRLGGKSVGRVWSFRDVTERKRFEDELQYLADHDALTGLQNRRRFEEELNREAARARRYDQRGAAILLDLDNFKYVNDTLGHHAGDEILVGIATLLSKRLRESDAVARLGGDEFAILLPQTSREAAESVGADVLRLIRDHGGLAGGRSVGLTTSLGVAVFGAEDTSGEEVLAAADLAMYEAKDSGRDRVVTFSPESASQAERRSRSTWIERIHQALEDDLFVLHAQPILDISKGEISQHELLLRMTGDAGELIPPGAFLGVAERFGLVQSIDRWVVARAVKVMDELLRQGQEVRLEVNLSGRSVDDRELPNLIRRELEGTSVNPDNLVLEITETALISNMDQARQFAEILSRVGCRFALDDFGAGFGSHYYLKHLPLNYVKIDGDFIRNLPTSMIDQLMVKAMVQVAKGLGMKTIAEFVENEETLLFLKQYGVDFAQGFHIGRPAPLSEVWPDAGL
jgi:diguanylate cyclase (GGDEF)-like protein/PAS domain S-box-containing protein